MAIRGKSPNQSSRIIRLRLTKKKDNGATSALNQYFFFSKLPPAPVFQSFGR